MTTIIDEKPLKQGLECHKCGCRHFYTVYTRPKKTGIVRLKECRNCGHRVLTKESIVN